jgi:hypothetical protein
MAEPQSGIRIFSLEEANLLLPLVKGELARLRELRKRIVSRQSMVDIEEMTGAGEPASQERIGQILREIEADVHVFHRLSEELNATGCELKDLDNGLIDFYGMHGGEVVYFCWKEGEECVSHWHTLDSGFKGRKKLEP